jgi:hypothetical protein
MTRVADELRGLFELVGDRAPVASDLERYFGARGLVIKPAGPNLDRPAWSTFVTPEDSFIDIGVDRVAGIRFGDDPRGYGAYVEIIVTEGTLQEIEAVTGPLEAMVPRSVRFDAAYARMTIHGHGVGVYVTHERGAVRAVLVQYPNAS